MQLEQNEAGWWSHWADVTWLGRAAYLMTSRTFGDEFFFNRAALVDCDAGVAALQGIEDALTAAGRRPRVTVSEECGEAVKALESMGYVPFEGMSVMQLGEPAYPGSARLSIRAGADVSPDQWARVYSLSFYGDLGVHDAVTRIATEAAGDPDVTLFTGLTDGRAVASLAAFRTPGLLGVYCVGTLKEYRRLGIAGSLISSAARSASAEGRSVILQTIASDNVDAFYLNGGFRRLYSKRLFEMKPGPDKGGAG